MRTFADLMARSNEVIRDRLSDCSVTIANTSTLPIMGGLPRSEHGDLVVRGIYGEPYDPGGEREDYTPSVSIPTITRKTTLENNRQQLQSVILSHKTRVLIARDPPYELVRLVMSIQRIENDGQGRTTLSLHAHGPYCADVGNEAQGFPYSLPILFAGVTFYKCADLYPA